MKFGIINQRRMAMGKGLQPDIYVKSIYTLDINWLIERGIKGVILDIDNTLDRKSVV